MGFTQGLFSGDQGANFTAASTPLLTPTNADQISQDRGISQGALNNYGQFLAALQAQGGLNNQNQVYNQLQGVASGTGPNPAQAMLNQATGANVSNQAALIGSARGAGSNPGLASRNAATIGGSVQQQAAGQGATMQANQALNAISAAGQLASTQAGQQLQGQGAYNNLAQNQRALTLGAAQGYNNNLNSAINGANSTNAGIAQGNQAFQAGVVKGVTSGAMQGLAAAHGGMIPSYANGTPDAPVSATDVASQGASAPQSATAKFLKSVGETADTTGTLQTKSLGQSGMDAGNSIGNALGKGAKSAFGSSPSGPGLGGGPSVAMQPVSGAGFSKGGNVGSKLKQGGKVPGQAKVKGDDYANDTVAAKLSPGEVVIPRSVMQSQDPVKAAAGFVAAVMAKSGKMPRKS